MFMVYIWLSTFFKSCNNDNVITDVVETVEESAEDLVDEGEDILEEADEFFEEEDINYEELDADQDFEDDDTYEEDVEFEPLEESEEEDYEEETVEAAPVAPSKPRVSTNTSGNYFVITGSYLLKSNAVEMRSKLERLGHDAEILNFDGSEYHAVTSGRYRNYEDATSVSRELSGKGIDNYVHRRK